MSNRTHQKELARARARREAQRAGQLRTRRTLGAGIVVVVMIAAIVVGFALQGSDPDTDPAAAASPTAESTASPGSGATPTDGSQQDTDQAGTPPPMVIDPSATYTATLEATAGTIVVDLAAAEAPTTVNNFVALATTGFYEGVVFHRIGEGFVIQGGDPTGTGTGGPGYTFDDELAHAREVVEANGGLYPRGTLAMANSGPDTNGSQFFIVDAEPGYAFPPNYTIFGMVTSGLDTVDTIAAGEVSGGAQVGLAVDPVTITSVTIDGPVDQAALGDWAPVPG